MADIKFSCPQCKQKIAVDPAAAGVKIDCPRCGSTLVIPSSAEGPIAVITRRQLATLAADQKATESTDTHLRKELDELKGAAKSAGQQQAKINADLQEARQKLEKAHEELAALESRVSALVHEGEEWKAARDALKEEAASAQKNLAAARAEITVAKSDAWQAREESAAATKAKEKAEGERSATLTELEQMKAKAAAPNAELAEARNQVTKVKEELSSLHAQRDKETKEAELDRQKSGTEFESLRKQSAELQAAYDSLKANEEKVRNDALAFQISLEKAKEALKDLRATELRLGQEKERAVLDLGEAKAELQEVERLKNELSSSNQAKVEALKHQQETQKALEDFRAKLATLESASQGSTEQLQESERILSETREQLARKERERSSIEEKLAAATKALAEVETSRENDHKTLGALQAELQARKSDNTRLQEEAKATLAQSSALKEDRDRLAIESAELRAKIGQNSEAHAKVEEETSELRKRYEAVFRELEEARATLSMAESARAGAKAEAEQQYGERLRQEVESTVEVLNSQLTQSRRRTEELNRELSEARDQQKISAAAIETAANERQQERKGIEAELLQARTAYSTAEEERKQLRQELDQSDENGRNLRERADVLGQEKEAMAKELVELRKTAVSAAAAKAADDEKAGHRLRELEEALATHLRGQKEQLEQREAAKAELERVQALLANTTSEHERTWATLAVTEKRNSTLESDLRLREESLVKEREEAGNLRRELDKALQETLDRSKRVQELEGSSALLHASQQEGAGKLEAASRALAEEKKKSADVLAERDQLVSQVNGLANDRSRVAEDLRLARAELSDLKNQISGMPLSQGAEASRVVMLDAQGQQSEVDALKAALERAKQHVSVLQTRRDQMRDEIMQLKSALGKTADGLG